MKSEHTIDWSKTAVGGAVSACRALNTVLCVTTLGKMMKRLTATELIAQLQGMILAGEITSDAMVMLQGPRQSANTMGNLIFISPRIPVLDAIPNGVILCSE